VFRWRCKPRAAIFAAGSETFPICTWNAATAPTCCLNRRHATRCPPLPAAQRSGSRPCEGDSSYSHSLSDDERLYRSDEERVSDAERDPVKSFAPYWSRRLVSQEELQQIKVKVDRDVAEALSRHCQLAARSRHCYSLHLFTRCRSHPKDFDTEKRARLSGNPGTMVDLINRCLHTEMARDPRIVVFGEDVADCSREQNLDKGQGQRRSF